MKLRSLSILALLLLAASCGKPVAIPRPTIPLVSEIAANSTGSEHIMLAAHAKPAASGEIYIAGSKAACDLLGEDFLQSDIFENARGRKWSDGLKDFAGETFCSISDDSFSPYSRYTIPSDSLRELAVRFALAAIDTRCNVSLYDLDGNAEKVPAKIIVLADPCFHESGLFDVDTLFTLTGCGVPVVSPQDLMFDAVMEKGEKKSFNIGVMCDSTYLGTGLYQSIFNAKTREHGIVGARFFEAAGGKGEEVLYPFLEAYEATGNTTPLDAILVDDWRIQPKELENELQALRDFSREESMSLGKLVSPDLRIICSSEKTLEECYGILRSRSLFTHKIAQPQSRLYTVSPRPWAEDVQFLLIPTANVQN